MTISIARHLSPLPSSERWVLDVIRRFEPIARSDLTQHVDLAQQSVHRIVETLIGRGFVRTGEPLKRGRGQPSVVLELQRDAVFSIGISVNTDSTTVCLVDLACRTVEQIALREPPLSRSVSLEAIRDAVDRMTRRNGVTSDRIIGIGFAIAGFFVPGGGINAPEPLRNWSLVDLKPEFEAYFGMPIWVENNATTGAIGEKMRGAGLWARSFAYFSFNYGFGMGLILDGKPYFGSHRNAGEMRMFRPDDETENRPALRYLIDELRQNGVRIDSVADLKERFDPAWPGVEAWVDRIMPQLDRAVNAVTGVVDPEAIVYGGQIPRELGLMLIDRTQHWGGWRYGVAQALPKLVLSEANVDPAAAGAAMLPLDAVFFP